MDQRIERRMTMRKNKYGTYGTFSRSFSRVLAAAFVAAAGYGLISMVLKKELFVRMRDGFLYLNGILCGRFMRYRGQGKAVSFAVYVLLGTAMADIWFYGMR